MRIPILPGRRQSLAVMAALSFLVIDLGAQTTQNTPATTGPTFDVISIKPHAGDPNSSSMRQMPGGGIIFVNGSVRTLIGRGYPGLVSGPVGLPPWATSEQYNVNATASLKNPTIEDRQAMMRALLADRFKFAAHLETQEQPSFDLVLARKDGRLGPGLKPSEIDSSHARRRNVLPPTRRAPRVRRLRRRPRSVRRHPARLCRRAARG